MHMFGIREFEIRDPLVGRWNGAEDGEAQAALDVVGPDAGVLHQLLPGEADLLEAARRTEDLGPDAKAEALLEWIYRLQQEEGAPELKVLVFTEFVPTQAMLRDFLTGRGFTVVCLNGSLSMDERTRVQEEFAGDTRILVSTDAGGVAGRDRLRAIPVFEPLEKSVALTRAGKGLAGLRDDVVRLTVQGVAHLGRGQSRVHRKGAALATGCLENDQGIPQIHAHRSRSAVGERHRLGDEAVGANLQ